MINIGVTSERNFSIYSNSQITELMNNYNKYTKKNIEKINRLISKKYFIVPSLIFELDWGNEKVFLPFTNKLFKIISTYKGNTSLQLHPLKSEKYISLSDATVVNDEEKEVLLKKSEFVSINNNTIHSLKKNSIVFEEQDNNMFDLNETIRIHDSLGRNTNSPQEYYKYLLPHIKNKMQFDKVSENHYSNKSDKFVFIVDGLVKIMVDGQEIELNKINELYFVDRSIEILSVSGIARIVDCNYYCME